MIGLLRGQGASGVPSPVPLDFAALPAPASPNWWVALPEGESAPGARWQSHRLPAATVDRAWAALGVVAAGMPRAFPLAEWPERHQAQWVVRSALANFPDIVVAEVTADGRLRLHSRSLVGWSDFGVNRRRVEAWLAALERALR
jgi:hypothetical protein